MSVPIDPVSTAAWAELQAQRASFDPDLRGWFAQDPGRVDRLTFTLADLHVDLSKSLVTDDILASLVRLGEQTGVAEHYAAMLRGDHINTTEDRSVLHVALRVAEEMGEGRIVMLLADGGWKYLSAGLWSRDLDELDKDLESSVLW